MSLLAGALGYARLAEPVRFRAASNLSIAFRPRFEQARHEADLNAAVAFAKRAVDVTPPDNPYRNKYLSNFASALLARSDQTKSSSDLNTAISIFQQIVDTLSQPYDPRYSSNLGLALLARYEQTRQQDDLEASIKALRQAVQASPSRHPNSARHLSNLASPLRASYEVTGHLADLNAAATSLQAALAVDTAPPRIRMTAAEAWAVYKFQTGDVVTATNAYAAALELLPQVAWHGLDRMTQEEHLSARTGLASDAASSAIAAAQPNRAVEMLEHGRSVLWAQVQQIRSDLARLYDCAPELAERLDQIRNQLDRPLRDTESRITSLPRLSRHT